MAELPARYTGDDIEKEQIFMSDINNLEQFMIYQADNDYNCVESYTICGGSEQPFEYVTLKINKKQLSVLAPDLVSYIIPGRNIVTLFGPGQGEYVVTKCSKSGDTWTVTAYSLMEQLRGLTLTDNINLSSSSPTQLITYIMQKAKFEYVTPNINPLNLVNHIYFFVRSSNDTWSDTSYNNDDQRMFKAGTSYWYIVQVCALKLDAKVWMADGSLYVIDTTMTRNDIADAITSFGTGVYPFDDIDTIYLNSEGGFPLYPSIYQKDVLQNIISTPELGEDGCNVLRNHVTVGYTNGNKENATTASPVVAGSYGTAITDAQMQKIVNSLSLFNMKNHQMSIPEIGVNDAFRIACSSAARYSDAETSIEFEMREIMTVTTTEDEQTTTKKVWVPFFGPLTRIKHIVDYANETTVSVMSNFDGTTEMMNKGMLSYYESTFPAHTTKYTFGISTPTDMTQNNSEILNILYNS